MQVSLGFSSSKSQSSQSQTTLQGSSATAGGDLTIVARGDNAADAQNGTIAVTAGTLSGQDVTLAASGDITLQSGVETSQTESSAQSVSASVGVVGSIGTDHAGASVTASVSGSTQHSQSDSTTHVVTTVTGSNNVTLVTSGTTTLDGATVSGGHIGVQTGNLVITSPQDEAHYESHSASGGASITVPIPGAGAGSVGGGGSVSGSSVTDTYRSTGKDQSGLYAGEGGAGCRGLWQYGSDRRGDQQHGRG